MLKQFLLFTQTIPDHESKSGFIPSISHVRSLPLYILSRKMCSYDLTKIRPFPDFVRVVQKGKDRDELYRNDGVVPVFSQWHPLSCQYVTETIGNLFLADTTRLLPEKQSVSTIELWPSRHILSRTGWSLGYGMCSRLTVRLTLRLCPIGPDRSCKLLSSRGLARGYS